MLEIGPYHIELYWITSLIGLIIIIAACLKQRWVFRTILALVLVFSIALLFLTETEQNWESLTHQMYASHRTGNKELSLHTARQLLALAEQQYPDDSTRMAESLHHVGWLLVDLRRYKEAETYFDKSIPLYEQLDPHYPDNHSLVCTHGVGNDKSIQGQVYEMTGRLTLAEQFYTEALEHYRKRCPGFPQYHDEMTRALARIHKKKP